MGYIKDDEFITQGNVPTDTRVGLVLDRTCAYSEAGGQVGDKGRIESETGTAVFYFDDTCKIGPAVVHFGQLKSAHTGTPGTNTGTNVTGVAVAVAVAGADIIAGADIATTGIDTTTSLAGTTTTDTATSAANTAMAIYNNVSIRIDPSRDDIRRNHTATHLLQWALREVLGEHVHQEGSYVGAEYLRFDFTHSHSLTPQQISQVEQLVREKIDAALPVTFDVLPIEKAQKVGAMALFSEKYGSHVRVLAIGTDRPDRLEDAFSREFCGGTHVNNTREIGPFKIIREESVATGVRRITAMTGRALTVRFYQQWQQLGDISAMLKVPLEQIVPRLEKLLQENKELHKQVKKGASSDLKSVVQDLLDKAPQINSSRIITGTLPAGASIELIRSQIDWLRKKAPSSVIVLATAPQKNKVLLISAVTDDLVKKGLKAGDIVKHIAPIVGGGGGGRPQMAQAGGKDPSQIPAALDAAHAMITSKLSAD